MTIDVVAEKKSFRTEFVLAVMVAAIASFFSMFNIFMVSNDLFPTAIDFLGHMAKIEFIADSLKSGIVPRWFPYWYSGTTVTQYYPPLSYYMLAIPYILTSNPMLTFKIFVFSAQFVASLGLWYLYRTYIGSWTGLLVIGIYCFQPFIISTLIEQGQVAQGPIIMMTPWYLVSIIRLVKNSSKSSFVLCVLLCSAMILSHPNTVFMLCLCLLVVLLLFVITKSISLPSYLLYVLTIIFAGMVTAFWSVAGVTGLENPTIPDVLPEAIFSYSANISWFLGKGFMGFSFFSLMGAFGAIILYNYNKFKQQSLGNNGFVIMFLSTIMVLSLTFSFGLSLSFFKYIPMSHTFFAGRMLNFTSMTAALLCGYLIKMVLDLGRNRKWFIRTLSVFMTFAILSIIFVEINPLVHEYEFWDSKEMDRLFSQIKRSPSDKEKVRFIFLGAYPSSMSYFPIKYGFLLDEGFNIEGTVHHAYHRNLIIANASGAYDYYLKNMAFNNVRYFLFQEAFEGLVKPLVDTFAGIRIVAEGDDQIYASTIPPYYLMRDKRNALIFGPGSRGIAIEFPYLVYEDRNNIYDFSLEELSRYKLIYISEPNIVTIQHKRKTEEIIKELVKRDTTVIIAPSVNQRHDLFGVMPQYYKIGKKGVIYKNKNTQFDEANDVDMYVNFDGAYFLGLDENYYVAKQEGTMIENDVIGAKNIEGGKVIFLGMNLSHHLKSVSTLLWGGAQMEVIFSDETYEKKDFFEDFFEDLSVEKDFFPVEYPTRNFHWNDSKIYFDYTSEKSEEVTLSITYAPRWKAYVDGEQISVGQKENLMVFKLPKGDHSVELVYGTTIYGIIGYVISGISLLLLLLFMRNYGKMICLIDARTGRIKSMLEI